MIVGTFGMYIFACLRRRIVKLQWYSTVASYLVCDRNRLTTNTIWRCADGAKIPKLIDKWLICTFAEDLSYCHCSFRQSAKPAEKRKVAEPEEEDGHGDVAEEPAPPKKRGRGRPPKAGGPAKKPKVWRDVNLFV